MTRKEILLDIAERCGIDIDGSEYVITYNRDTMIKFKRWLFKELKNADKEPCEDCVSRQAVHDGMIKYGFHASDMTITEFVEDVLPSVTPTYKKGKWIKVKNGRGGHECSICQMYAPSYQSGDEYLSRFCPNCGAEMESEE